MNPPPFDAQPITWKTTTRRLSQLIPWEINPREIKRNKATRLTESIRKFGQVETIAIGPDRIIDGQVFNDIYNGHQRYKVLQAKYGENYIIEARISNRFLTEDERRELTIFLHKGAVGDWDFDTLANHFSVQELLDGGFTKKDLDLDLWLDDSMNAPTQEERAEELQETWDTQPGQLWQLGRHFLICGDSTNYQTVKRLCSGRWPEMMVTDPPYGVQYEPEWRTKIHDTNLATFRTGKIKGDETASWLKAWQLFKGDIAYVWHASLYTDVVKRDLEMSGLISGTMIVWQKNRPIISRGNYQWRHELCAYVVRKTNRKIIPVKNITVKRTNRLRESYEETAYLCWVANRKGRQTHWAGDRKQNTVWEIGLDNDITATGGHSTQKPVECMERPIRNHDAKHIYDPFCGSGTTIIAAEKQKRICLAVELDPVYVAIILQRWLDAGGEKPVLTE